MQHEPPSKEEQAKLDIINGVLKKHLIECDAHFFLKLNQSEIGQINVMHEGEFEDFSYTIGEVINLHYVIINHKDNRDLYCRVLLNPKFV